MRGRFEAVKSLTRQMAAASLFAAVSAPVAHATALAPQDMHTITPIRHVIVILGENRSFDHIFGLYVPPPGQSIWNILSEGIVTKDGAPGPNFAKARQYYAEVRGTYDPAPARKQPYTTLPPPLTGSAPRAASDKSGPPFATLAYAADIDAGIEPSALHLLLTGATQLPRHALDSDIANATRLPDGPYPLTPSVPYDAYTASPTHRFFQMWQQLDCSVRHATARSPGGCLADLFPWVEVTVGPGSNGKAPPAHFDARSTGEGSAAMGFYNMAAGDAPYLKSLARRYTLADNYHQAAIGGTGANHVVLGTGDMVFYSDGKGRAATPPKNEIENPNPRPGTNNYYTQDGYEGGSYVDCADAKAPGVAPILDYLKSLSPPIRANCAPGRYYLVNNYNPGYLGNGAVDTVDRYTVPPVDLPTIGDVLLKHHISFRWYGEGWDAYVQDPKSQLYCNICNFLQYSPTIMASATRRIEHIADIGALYNDIADDALPAVVYVKPSSVNDGHPASSKLDLFESFTKKIITAVRSNHRLWLHTAIFITFDEGGGYWDSGYVQALDFFGDGTRVPLIVVSPYSKGGRVVHTYDDHVSILKFIERNWSLPPVSRRSRDNLPDPVASADLPYVPTNRPAIGDLMDMFRF